MSMVGKRGTWWRWNDATGEQTPVPVVITGEFYEPGDPILAYNLKDAITGEPYGGIDSQDVEVHP